MIVCVRYLITGRVQGVFFRAATRNKAAEMGLKGRARNLDDGRVEVIACGPREHLAALEEWLWEGPPHARVSEVTSAPADDEGFSGFEIE